MLVRETRFSQEKIIFNDDTQNLCELYRALHMMFTWRDTEDLMLWIDAFDNIGVMNVQERERTRSD